jgi:HSP20 family molecular chaperone IbpA
MFFTTTSPAVFRRQNEAPNSFALERFLQRAQIASGTCCVEEKEDHYVLSLDVPGVTREQLSIAIEGTVVRVQSKPEASRSYRWACELPQDVDASTSEAKLELGVLSVRLTKLVQPSRVTELAIN